MPIATIPNVLLAELFHTYLGLPSPAMQPFISTPHLVGCKGEMVDPWGDAVAIAVIKGNDYQEAHNELKIMVGNIMKQSGLMLVFDPRNTLHGKISE